MSKMILLTHKNEREGFDYMFLSTQIIEIIIGLLFIIWLYLTYVSVIKKRNKVQEAFASVDVQLKKRYDNIPNILTIAAKFMEHEKSLIEDVTKLRTQYANLPNTYDNIDEKISLSNELASKMGNLTVAVENYPQLKSDQTMIVAMQTYNEVEEHISAARRFYNSAANELKNAVEIFPSSLRAKLCGIKAVEFFKISEIERQSVKAADFFK